MSHMSSAGVAETPTHSLPVTPISPPASGSSPQSVDNSNEVQRRTHVDAHDIDVCHSQVTVSVKIQRETPNTSPRSGSSIRTTGADVSASVVSRWQMSTRRRQSLLEHGRSVNDTTSTWSMISLLRSSSSTRPPTPTPTYLHTPTPTPTRTLSPTPTHSLPPSHTLSPTPRRVSAHVCQWPVSTPCHVPGTLSRPSAATRRRRGRLQCTITLPSSYPSPSAVDATHGSDRHSSDDSVGPPIQDLEDCRLPRGRIRPRRRRHRRHRSAPTTSLIESPSPPPPLTCPQLFHHVTRSLQLASTQSRSRRGNRRLLKERLRHAASMTQRLESHNVQLREYVSSLLSDTAGAMTVEDNSPSAVGGAVTAMSQEVTRHPVDARDTATARTTVVTSGDVCDEISRRETCTDEGMTGQSKNSRESLLSSLARLCARQ
eukprot:GFYU01014779.1.p1 GENE.GFYU01014779.1~~GFYU01014779.1.p1  ORF type:complete len:429 (-),score=34.05 GFYU01014779.1:78-1364(-)